METDKESADHKALFTPADPKAARPASPGTTVPSATPVQVPPASQLDPHVLAHLPTPMRHQIEAVLQERQTPTILSSPLPSTPSKRRKASTSPRTPRRTPSTSPGRQSRLSAYFSPTRRASSEMEREVQARGWDLDVFLALPPAVQADLLRAPLPRRVRTSSAPARTAAAQRRFAAESAVLHEAHIRRAAGAYDLEEAVQRAAARPAECGVEPRASLVEVDACHPEYAPWAHASLSPALPLATLRTQLSAWHRACAHSAPQAGDVAQVQRVLEACVQAQALDKVQGMLQWWHTLSRRAHPAWQAAYVHVQARVQALLRAHYGATISVGS